MYCVRCWRGRLVAWSDAHQPRQAVGDGTQGLAADQRLRAASAHPAREPAVGGDHRRVTGMCGGRGLGAYHRRQDARPACSGVLGQQGEQLAVYSVTPLERNAAHTLSEVTGMSMLAIPSGESASTTALT